MPLGPFEFVVATLYVVALVGLLLSAIYRSWKGIWIFLALLIVSAATSAGIATF